MLVGMGGSGRQCLSKLAAALSNFDIFQIEVTKSYGIAEWREDLKVLHLFNHSYSEPHLTVG